MEMSFDIRKEKIIEDSKQLKLDDRFESDSISYHHFIKFFADKKQLTENDLIVSAYFSYGWMPTILNLNFQDVKDLEIPLQLLNKVKSGTFLKSTDLEILKKLFNNSIVGTSKLLHFICPSNYLIWDSRVANYFGIKVYKKVNSVEFYLRYLDFCHKLDKNMVNEVHLNVIEKAPCMKDATTLRALEFVFFNKGIKPKKPKGIATS